MPVSDRISTIEKFFRTTPIFQELSAEQLTALATIAIPQTYKR